MILPALHHRLGPFNKSWFVTTRTDGNLEHPLTVALLCGIKVPDKEAVDLELAQIIVSRHIAAAVPDLVADAEHRNFVRRRMTVGRPLFRERRCLRRREIFQPFSCFLWRAGTD